MDEQAAEDAECSTQGVRQPITEIPSAAHGSMELMPFVEGAEESDGEHRGKRDPAVGLREGTVKGAPQEHRSGGEGDEVRELVARDPLERLLELGALKRGQPEDRSHPDDKPDPGHDGGRGG